MKLEDVAEELNIEYVRDNHRSTSRFLQQDFLCLMMNDTSYFSGNNKFYKQAADIREQLKPTLAVLLKPALGNDSIGEDILDELLKKSDLLKELWVFQ